MADLLTLPIARVTDPDGNPVAGALMDSFLTGTLTPTDVYTDDSLGTAHANPVVADGDGLFPSIYLDPDVTYRFRIRTSAGVAISGMDFDPVQSATVSELEFLQAGTGAVSRLVSDKLKDTISPLEFGAIGNGVANDAAALTAMDTAHPGRFTLGGGLTYKITSNLPAGFMMHDGEILDSRTIAADDAWSVVGLGWDTLTANTFIPEQHASSGPFYASGNHVVAIGGQAGKNNTTGRRQVFIGSRAGLSNTTGYYNTYVGSHSGENGTTGYENTGCGVQTLGSLTTGHGNCALGVGAGNKITTAVQCIGIGQSAMAGVSAGSCTATDFIGIGFQALGFAQTGNDCIAIGSRALQVMTGADSNIAIGTGTLKTITTASNNIAIGGSALTASTAAANVAVGTSAGQAATTGTANVLIGHQAALVATTLDNSTIVGHQAGIAVSTGDSNTLVGKSAGATITTGGTNTCVGNAADTIAASDNSTSLGNGASSTASNQVTLGNGSIATLRCQQTSITALSDKRFKTATPNGFSDGLAFICDVTIRDFKWNGKAGKVMQGRRELGIFAQELDEAAKAHGLEWLGLVDHTNPDCLEATPGKMLFPLIQAVQQLTARNAALEARIAKLES